MQPQLFQSVLCNMVQAGERRSLYKMARLLQCPLHVAMWPRLFFRLGCSGKKGRFSCPCNIWTMVQYSLPTPTSFSYTDLPYCDFLSPFFLCWNLCENKVLKIKNLLGLTLVCKVHLEKSPRRIFLNLKLQI